MLFLHTLGTARIDAGSTRLTPTSVRKFALLLHLSAEPGRRVPREMLRDLIFPDRTDDSARHSIRELIYGFRRIGVRIDSDKHGMALEADAVASDYRAFMDGERLDEAQLAAAAGGFLPGYAPEHSEAYSEWLEGFRARSTFELCKSLLKELARAKRVGDWAQAERAARACLALDPLNEEATLGLAEMLAIGGAKVAAVRLLDAYLEEVGLKSGDLTVSAKILRRRISEQLGTRYQSPPLLPFTGREDEMASISDAIARAAQGEANCVVLYGEPGIGKTRLVEEACARATFDGFRVEKIAVEPNDCERPFSAFVDLVPKLQKLPGALGASPESLSALSRLTTHTDADSVARMQPEAVRSMITHGIDDLVEAITSEVPLLVFADDVQWLDSVSLGVLAGVASTRRYRRLCLLLATRDTAISRSLAGRLDRVLTMRVAGLGLAQCEHLVNTASSVAAANNPQLSKWLAATSAGNPFFLQALIGHYSTTKQAYKIPQSINTLLDQSILALSETARAVLVCIVSLGRYCTLERLSSSLELPHIQLFSAITELESVNLIVGYDERISVRHALIAETVPRHVTPVAMKAHHKRIASVLEIEARSSRNSAMYWVCADHWLDAEETERAIEILNECVQHAIEIGRPREAAELLTRAAALSKQPFRDKLAREAVRIAHQSSEADVVRRALALVSTSAREPQHDELELAEFYAHGLCELEAAHAARISRCVLDDSLPIEHRVAAGWMMLVVADFQRLDDLAVQVFTKLDPLLADLAAVGDVQALLFYLVFHSCFGDPDEAGRIATRLIGVAEHGAIDVAADLYRKAAIGFWRAGLTDRAIDALEAAFAGAVKAGLARLQVAASMMLAEFLQDLCEDARSAVWMERAERVLDEYPGTSLSAEHYALLSEAALGRNDEVAVAKFAELLRTSVALDAPSRATRWAQALHFSQQLKRGAQTDADSAVQLLTGHHVKGAERGDPSDNETAMAVRILLRCGDSKKAHGTLDRYFEHYRAGRAPVSRFLRLVMQEATYSIEPRMERGG